MSDPNRERSLFRQDATGNEVYRSVCARDGFDEIIRKILHSSQNKEATLIFCNAGRHRSMSCVRYISEKNLFEDESKSAVFHLAKCCDRDYNNLKAMLKSRFASFASMDGGFD